LWFPRADVGGVRRKREPKGNNRYRRKKKYLATHKTPLASPPQNYIRTRLPGIVAFRPQSVIFSRLLGGLTRLTFNALEPMAFWTSKQGREFGLPTTQSPARGEI
jgi:hypothetical protein